MLVVNPSARHGLVGEAEARRAFLAAGVKYRVARTERAGHAAQLAREGSTGVDAVFTLGGDGTAMEVVGALVGTGLPVAILAGGTGNQLVRHLQTPLSIGRAVPALLGGRAERLDVGRLRDGRRFALTAGFGIDAAMMAGASAAAKRRFGVATYVWSGARALIRNERFHVRATVDGVTHDRECVLAMIVNIGSLFGGRIAAGPGVVADDGMLDLCLFSARSTLEGLDVVRRCATHDFRPHRNMFYARGREIGIETSPPAAAQADGDLLPPGALEAIAEPGAALLVRAQGSGAFDSRPRGA